MSYVTIDNISKYYGEVSAIEDISIDVKEGEFVSILGPSGSGKTTTLTLLAGFEEPDTGSITVDEESMLGKAPEDREMSLVFQRLALFPHMTVAENIAFGLRMKDELGEEEIEARVAEVLELVSLPGYQDRNIQSLSGGEQQRIALARALVMRPKLLLYDEPLSDLDRQLREDMRREIKELHENLGITSLYVTHNQREALTLSDRIVVLNEGKKVRYDTPENIYNEPKSEFVANFVGDSNFVTGALTNNGGSWSFENGNLTFPLSEPSTDLKDQAKLYIRPEDLSLSRADAGTGNGKGLVYPGEVTSTVHLGSVTEYTVEIEGEEFLVTDLGAPQYRSGDEVMVEFENYGVVKPGD